MPAKAEGIRTTLWSIQSVDTMKYSRDVARIEEKNNNFDSEIDRQISDIKDLGATHVAIATPYDDEFIPYMTRWINSTRKHGLKVWFRGNFSGWENWYSYPDITMAEHIQKTQKFILKNPHLFVDGDIYSPCHECENGGPGDPRQTGQVQEYRDFLISEYQVTRDSFKKINKQVPSNYFSMNLDVAKLIMDKKTVRALDSVIVLDHYIPTPKELIQDVKTIARQTGASIVLGEYGVPIPDIHGEMSPSQQAVWLQEAMSGLVEIPELVGLNYWVNMGSSTEIWDVTTHQKKPAAAVLAQYYFPHIVEGIIKNTLDRPVTHASVVYLGRSYPVDQSGHYSIPLMPDHDRIVYTAFGFVDQIHTVSSSTALNIVLEPSARNLLFRLQELIHLLVTKAHSIIESI
ncbi:MAG: hypothetical protein AAB909_02150 [Patescibacteria group bacterium]